MERSPLASYIVRSFAPCLHSSSSMLTHMEVRKKNGENGGTEQNKFSILLRFLPAPVTGEHGTGEARRKGYWEEAFFPTPSFLLLHFCFT